MDTMIGVVAEEPSGKPFVGILGVENAADFRLLPSKSFTRVGYKTRHIRREI